MEVGLMEVRMYDEIKTNHFYNETLISSILLVFLEVNCPRVIFIQLHIFMFLFLSIPPSVLLFPAVLFHFAFRHVCLHSRPPNNPINTGAPSLGPRVSLFSKVSYRAFSYDVIAAVWCTKTILWELNSFLMSMM